jgi:CRP-like cAMP-binding protein
VPTVFPRISCAESALTSESINSALITRLRTTSALDEQDVEAIRSLPAVIKHYTPGQAIVRDGDRPAECCLVSQGFCVRSKTTSNGRRQILSIHIPGEIPDLQSLHLHVLDHDICMYWIMISRRSPNAPWASSTTLPFERLPAEDRTSQKSSGETP